ncbi:Lrp/AsnC family transcriptional regulator [Salinigranum sp. GCM10025319]|uniref:Lrp/AsnC family transcriptional regulator n=1 Tax=Salinigranum sp. GCM10025319 TaxID=3252687 RepID=UPI00361482C2
MTSNPDEDPEYVLDEVDRGVLYALQRDARNVTAQEIAEEVNVSASTVRNRIANLEDAGVIRGYQPVINYEKAGYPLRVIFVATADPDERERLTSEILAVSGIVDVREMLTSRRNLFTEAVATDIRDLANITHALNEYGLEIVSSEIVAGHESQPFGELEM